MSKKTVTTIVTPKGHLDVLTRAEVANLLDASRGELYQLFRNCALAVLDCENTIDDGRELLERHKEFTIQLIQEERGVKLRLVNAPSFAFVDGEIMRGISEHLFSVLRDIVYIGNEIENNAKYDLESSAGITDAVFHILRNARILKPITHPNLVVCWGGHSISREEYDYTKEVGYRLGLRKMDVCTGCGPGAMKGPMKGATIGHAKQRIDVGRYIGMTEPGIIAAESPNPIVNDLVIFPDIEKRLEAFVRTGHGVIVFPGGAGTAEEILYIIGILLNPENRKIPFPLIFTGPASTAEYFAQIDAFIGATLGEDAQACYEIIIDNPIKVARRMKEGIADVREFRKMTDDAYYYNWRLQIDTEFQKPFEPTHENMRALELHKQQPVHLLAANLRRAFSGVVAGNVKDDGIRRIEQYGLFEIRGESTIMDQLDTLLSSFVRQQRMKLPGTEYTPCYQIVR